MLVFVLHLCCVLTWQVAVGCPSGLSKAGALLLMSDTELATTWEGTARQTARYHHNSYSKSAPSLCVILTKAEKGEELE